MGSSSYLVMKLSPGLSYISLPKLPLKIVVETNRISLHIPPYFIQLDDKLFTRVFFVAAFFFFTS